MKIFTRTLLATPLICLLAPAVVRAQDNLPKAASAQSDAKKAFEKLKTLTGSWQGTVMDIPINFTIRAASSGTAILHEGHTSGGRPPNHEITMFYVEGDRLLATHFCDAGNRSRWEGKMSPDGKAIQFSFLDVAGSTRGGYLKDMVITVIDADHHIVGFTFVMPDGKPIQLRGEFQRTSGQNNPSKAAAAAAQENPFTTHNNYVYRGMRYILLRSAEKILKNIVPPMSEPGVTAGAPPTGAYGFSG